MANRRCLKVLTLNRTYILSSNARFQTLITPSSLQILSDNDHLPLENPISNLHQIRRNFESLCRIQSKSLRYFSSQKRNSGKYEDGDNEDEDDDDDDDDEDEDDEEEEDEEGELSECSDGEGVGVDNVSSVSNRAASRTYSVEEKAKEADAIGYKVIGPLDPSERPFTAWEPVFAIVQIGSHQFKVSNGDAIYTEKLKFCEVNDKLILNKVLMLGSKSQTIIGRPILPDAAVHAVVEEHALDAKVIIFKKKRRKNYRRTKGHRQELTRLRITDIQGIEKPEKKIKVAA